MFSETASRTNTYDIPAGSAWCVGGHWPTEKSIKWFCSWLSGQEPVAVFYWRNLCLASIWQIISRSLKKSIWYLKMIFFFILLFNFVWRVGFLIGGARIARSTWSMPFSWIPFVPGEAMSLILGGRKLSRIWIIQRCLSKK